MEGMKQAGKIKSMDVSEYLRSDVEATLNGAIELSVNNRIE